MLFRKSGASRFFCGFSASRALNFLALQMISCILGTPIPAKGMDSGNKAGTGALPQPDQVKHMKKLYSLIPVAVLMTVTAMPAQADGRIYRCGNEYTNNAARIRQGGCNPVAGGNLTVVRGNAFAASLGNGEAGGAGRAAVHVARATAGDGAKAIPVNAPAPKRVVEDSAQRTRDAGARGILQTELDKATQRLAELRREYNNGEPEKMGSESRNYQKYLDRVAELRASISRTESDIAGLRRELGRSGG